MKQTHRLALRVAERRQRRSAIMTGHLHLDDIDLTPIERVRIRRQYIVTDEFKQAMVESGAAEALQQELHRFKLDAARRGIFPSTGLYDPAPDPDSPS
jgi:hypothetical protein